MRINGHGIVPRAIELTNQSINNKHQTMDEQIVKAAAMNRSTQWKKKKKIILKFIYFANQL